MDKAKTKLSVSCGCKFISFRIREGKEHAERTGHTLTVTGFILPPSTEKKIESNLASQGNLKALQGGDE